MKINNCKVYDLDESIVASGLPMQSEYNSMEFECAVNDCIEERRLGDIESNQHYKRSCKLAKNAPGTGHNNFLSGILVSANVTATNVWWLQLERYHFVQIVSMQSKMHRLREMISSENNCFHSKVICNAIDALNMAATAEETTYEWMVYNCPMGLELTARITTNYLQLKTIYRQRKSHKLQEWHDFCAWIENLPYAKELIGVDSIGISEA